MQSYFELPFEFELIAEASNNMTKKIYVIDGDDFSNLPEFAAVFSKVVLQDYVWQGNLNAFNDILRGGFGTPEEGFVLIWKNSIKSKRDLGYSETERGLEQLSETCLPDNQPDLLQYKEQARNRQGGTIFDWLIEILREHGPGGSEQEDGVILKLE